MRTFIATLFTFLLTIQAFAQDEIVLMKDSTIKAKVIEISLQEIIYRIVLSNEELIKSIPLAEVHKIVYENGDTEEFNEKLITKKIDRILNSGFFIDIVYGYAYFKYEYESDILHNMEKVILGDHSELGGGSASIGYNWFFGSGEKYKFGIETTWVRMGRYKNGHLFVTSLSPLNLGLINAFKFGEQTGLTVSATSGLNLLYGQDDAHKSYNVGYNLCADIKYRYRELAIGLNYLRMAGKDFETVYRSRFNSLGISVGLKF